MPNRKGRHKFVLTNINISPAAPGGGFEVIMSAIQFIKYKDIPQPNLTQGYESMENKPLNIVEEFRSELKIWCKANNKSRDEFCQLIGKPSHYINKVLTGDWNMAAHDLPAICSALGSMNLIEILIQKYQSFDARIQLELLKDQEAEFVHQLAKIRSDKRRVENQLKGE